MSVSGLRQFARVCAGFVSKLDTAALPANTFWPAVGPDGAAHKFLSRFHQTDDRPLLACRIKYVGLDDRTEDHDVLLKSPTNQSLGKGLLRYSATIAFLLNSLKQVAVDSYLGLCH